MNGKIEIVQNACYFHRLIAAINAGAGYIYYFFQQFNMRSIFSINLTITEIKKILSICKKNSVKAYILMFDYEFKFMKILRKILKRCGVDLFT